MRKIKFHPLEIPDTNLCRDQINQTQWYYTPHRVMYCDTDQAKVVYHGNYLKYFEMARDSLMRSIGGSYREIEESGYHHPIVNLSINYLRPLSYDDQINIYIRPSKLEVVRFTFDYRVMKIGENSLVATGSTQHCCINKKFIPVQVDSWTHRLFSFMGDITEDPKKNE